MEVLRIEEPRPVAVNWCLGIMTERETVAALRFAFCHHVLEPGMDRMVVANKRTYLHEIDLDALIGIRDAVITGESVGGRTPAFHSVIVIEDASHRPIAQLYLALWELLDLPGVRFELVDRRVEAFRLLGLPETTAIPFPVR